MGSPVHRAFFVDALGREARISGVASSVRHVKGVSGPRIGCPDRIGGYFFRGISRWRMPLRGGHHVEEESRVV